MTARQGGPQSSDLEHREFLVEVAWLCHEYGLTQAAIAARFGLSRSTISRALSEAEALGIVQVVVTEPMPGQARLAEALRLRYGIMAHVGARLGDEDGTIGVARATARLIERAVAIGRVTVAASWGRTLARAAHLVRPRRTTGVVVVDAIGHVSGGEIAPAVDVTRALGASLGATVMHLPSPAFVDSRSSLQSLLSSRPVETALEVARSADMTLVSVGVVGEDSLLLQAGLVSAETMHAIVEAGGVGEMLGRYYDSSGHALGVLSPLPVGLSLDELRGSRRVVAAAGGAAKASALHAALIGGLLDEVVVDEALGEALIMAR